MNWRPRKQPPFVYDFRGSRRIIFSDGILALLALCAAIYGYYQYHDEQWPVVVGMFSFGACLGHSFFRVTHRDKERELERIVAAFGVMMGGLMAAFVLLALWEGFYDDYLLARSGIRTWGVVTSAEYVKRFENYQVRYDYQTNQGTRQGYLGIGYEEYQENDTVIVVYSSYYPWVNRIVSKSGWEDLPDTIGQ